MRTLTALVRAATMPAIFLTIGFLAGLLWFAARLYSAAGTEQFWSAASAVGTIAGSLIAGFSFAVAAFSFRSQSKQNRISLATDMLMKLTDDFEGRRMHRARGMASEFLLNKSDQSNASVDAVLDFFEQVALLEKRGAIDIEFVWHAFYYWLFHYYYLTQHYRAAARSDDPTVWSDLQIAISTRNGSAT